MPHEGDNAVYRLAHAALALERMDFAVEPHPLMGAPSINVGTFTGGLNINSVPDSAVMGVDIRTITGQDHEALFHCLCHRLGSVLTLRRMLDIESVLTSADHPWVRRVFNICEERTRLPAQAGTVPFFTDAAKLRLPLGAPPVVILGPGETALAHQTDEYCRVDLLMEATQIYTDLIDDWCRSASET
jgi:succinyl-diaminopimelate desuccinylase